MKKKVLAVILTGVMSATVLAGCAAAPAAPAAAPAEEAVEEAAPAEEEAASSICGHSQMKFRA